MEVLRQEFQEARKVTIDYRVFKHALGCLVRSLRFLTKGRPYVAENNRPGTKVQQTTWTIIPLRHPAYHVA